jgi:DNA-binding MarR family transcriptional regulator
LLRKVQIDFGGILFDAAEKFGLTPSEALALVVIVQRPGLPQVAVGSEIGVQRSNFVATVKALEAGHLIETRPDPANRRHRPLYPTENGRKVADKIVSHVGERARLSEDEVAVLRVIIRRIEGRKSDQS